MQSVTFLPQEFGSTKEGTGSLFPTDDVCPLIDKHGQIAIGLHPFGIHFADYGFARGTNDQFFGQFHVADMRDQSHFGSKAFDVVGFFDEVTVRYEHGEVCVFVTGRFEAIVQFALNVFPHGVTVRTDDHGTFNRTVVHHLRL